MKITTDLPDDLLPIGTQVFIPRAVLGTVEPDIIIGYNCILEQDKDNKFVLQPTDYRLNTVNTERGGETNNDTCWKREEFFLSYQDALVMAKEYTVTATEEEWHDAIGYKGDLEEGYVFELADCELRRCCAATENIRMLLGDVAWTGKITALNRHILLKIIKAHEAPDRAAVLNKILKQMDIVWSD